MSHNNETDTSDNWIWIVIIGGLLFGVLLDSPKSKKSYNSSVYASWEEERIDRLEADVAYLYDKLKIH